MGSIIKKRKIKTIVLSRTSGDENEAKELINKVEKYLEVIKLFFVMVTDLKTVI